MSRDPGPGAAPSWTQLSSVLALTCHCPGPDPGSVPGTGGQLGPPRLTLSFWVLPGTLQALGHRGPSCLGTGEEDLLLSQLRKPPEGRGGASRIRGTHGRRPAWCSYIRPRARCLGLHIPELRRAYSSCSHEVSPAGRVRGPGVWQPGHLCPSDWEGPGRPEGLGTRGALPGWLGWVVSCGASGVRGGCDIWGLWDFAGAEKHRDGGLNHRRSLSHVPGARHPRPRGGQGWLLLARPWTCRWPSFPCVLTRPLLCTSVCPSASPPLTRSPVRRGQGPPATLLELPHRFKAPHPNSRGLRVRSGFQQP